MVPAPEPLVLNPRKCTHCGRCVPACPHGALRVGRAYIRVDAERCDGCGACVRVCAPGAIRLPGSAKRAATGAGARPAAKARDRGAPTPAAPRAREARVAPRAAAPAAAAPFAWTLTEAVAMLAVTLAAFMLRELALASGAVRSLPADTLVLARSGLLAAYYAVQMAVLWRLVARRGGTFADALGLKRPAGGAAGFARAVGLVLGGLVATRLIATLYGLLTRALGTTPDASAVTQTFGTSPVGLLLAVVMLVLVGPVVEECVFRGALLRGLAARVGAWPAILAQAALFAAFHRSWWLLLPMAVLGVALGWLAHSRTSLWPAIALHASYNALTLAAVAWVSR